MGQKERAVIALRRRKYQQGLLLKTDVQLENLEQLVRVVLEADKFVTFISLRSPP